MITSATAAIDNGSWVQFASLGIAFVLAAMIGLERELRAKSAGLRTHTVVGVGAALFMVISKYGFSDVLGNPSIDLDPSRIAAGIVSGIGFIGGGLIFVKGDAVRGLTTAATVWMAAAVGAAAGAGLWLLALVATALHLLVVYGVRFVERQLPQSSTAASSVEVTYDIGRGAFSHVLELVTSAGFTVAQVVVISPTDDERRARIVLSGQGSVAEMTARIETITGVTGVRSNDANAAIE